MWRRPGILTVHEGAVTKYMDVSLAIAKEYDVSAYTIQRLDAQLSIKSLSRTIKQADGLRLYVSDCLML
jgi:DNA polymerase II large subunit